MVIREGMDIGSLESLVADLAREDELGAVVRAHIRLEAILIEIVDLLCRRPAHLRKMNIEYSSLVDLSLALGLHESFGPPLKTMGSIRNAFAHRLGTKLDKQRCDALIRGASTFDKDVMQAVFLKIKDENEATRGAKRIKDLDPLDQFRLMATVLWAKLQVEKVFISKEGRPSERP